ncbi:MAG: flagellar hook-associated protein FlgK [Gemmatimonadetes bacterium]|nr:flagellar hook-associated protein FlgK [Gemmatimonadota bacterium]MBI3568677.1 flagellar hook-associated protein FlgK [Gemmatimonadota bacterium]
MSSIASLLNTARSAVVAQQAAVQVAGHNIANAQTAGYTREVVDLTASTPETTPMGTFGTGVSVSNVTSMRDSLLSQDVRTQGSTAANAKTNSDLLGRVESVLGDPATSTLSSAIDNFYNAWSDLASNPTTASAKTVVQQRATALASVFNGYAGQLTQVRKAATDALTQSVTTVNSLVKQIADINQRIVPAESSGQSANDLRDQRDQLLDKLSSLVSINVIDRPDGSDQVTLGGISIVDGTDAKSLAVGNGATATVTIAGSPDALRNVGAQVGAQLDFLNSALPSVKSGLDTIAAAIITDVNAVHRTGWSPPSGAAGNWNPAAPPTGSNVDFFDSTPANATAANMRLSAAVAADPNAIAAGAVLNGAGDNTVALQMAALRDHSPSAPGQNVNGAFQTLVSQLAVQKNSSDNSATVYQTLANQATARRQSATGVSTDEELINVIKFQQAYTAAAKYMTTVDQMSQSLLSIVQ